MLIDEVPRLSGYAGSVLLVLNFESANHLACVVATNVIKTMMTVNDFDAVFLSSPIVGLVAMPL